MFMITKNIYIKFDVWFFILWSIYILFALFGLFVQDVPLVILSCTMSIFCFVFVYMSKEGELKNV